MRAAISLAVLLVVNIVGYIVYRAVDSSPASASSTDKRDRAERRVPAAPGRDATLGAMPDATVDETLTSGPTGPRSATATRDGAADDRAAARDAGAPLASESSPEECCTDESRADAIIDPRKLDKDKRARTHDGQSRSRRRAEPRPPAELVPQPPRVEEESAVESREPEPRPAPTPASRRDTNLEVMEANPYKRAD